MDGIVPQRAIGLLAQAAVAHTNMTPQQKRTYNNGLQSCMRKYLPLPPEPIALTVRPTALKTWKVETGDSCPVCLADLCDFPVARTACGHVFHADCIRACAKRTTKCPMCRANLALDRHRR